VAPVTAADFHQGHQEPARGERGTGGERATLDLFTETRAERIQMGYPAILNGSDEESCPFQLFDTSGWNLSDPNHTLNTWISMLIYYMTDYRYVYE
jgi:hypothetical protein